MVEGTDTKVRYFTKVNGREAAQSPQCREESGIKGECEVGKSECNYMEVR